MFCFRLGFGDVGGRGRCFMGLPEMDYGARDENKTVILSKLGGFVVGLRGWVTVG